MSEIKMDNMGSHSRAAEQLGSVDSNQLNNEKDPAKVSVQIRWPERINAPNWDPQPDPW